MATTWRQTDSDIAKSAKRAFSQNGAPRRRSSRPDAARFTRVEAVVSPELASAVRTYASLRGVTVSQLIGTTLLDLLENDPGH